MNRENLEKWLNDLETTTDPQARSALTGPAGDCCLGRLCKVAIADGVSVETEKSPFGFITYDGGTIIPPVSVQGWLGVFYQGEPTFYDHAMDMNDSDGKSFKEIAAEIRKEYT